MAFCDSLFTTDRCAKFDIHCVIVCHSENRSTFAKVTIKHQLAYFFETQCIFFGSCVCMAIFNAHGLL